MAEHPNAEEDWRRHSSQWQMYTARGLGSGVLKAMAPHWQEACIFAVGV